MTNKMMVEMVKNETAFLAPEAIMETALSYGRGMFVTIEWCTPLSGLRKADLGKVFCHYKGQMHMGIDYDHRRDVIEAKENGYNPDHSRPDWRVWDVQDIAFHHRDNANKRYLMVNLVDRDALFHEYLDGEGNVITRADIAARGMQYVLDKKDNARARAAQPDKPKDTTRMVKFNNIIALGSVPNAIVGESEA